MQKWEYLTLTRVRDFKFGFSTVNTTPWSRDIPTMLPELGREGWELIGIASGSNKGSPSSSGITNEETWVFKRPLE